MGIIFGGDSFFYANFWGILGVVMVLGVSLWVKINILTYQNYRDRIGLGLVGVNGVVFWWCDLLLVVKVCVVGMGDFVGVLYAGRA